jgi:hypothetical protein
MPRSKTSSPTSALCRNSGTGSRGRHRCGAQQGRGSHRLPLPVAAANGMKYRSCNEDRFLLWPDTFCVSASVGRASAASARGHRLSFLSRRSDAPGHERQKHRRQRRQIPREHPRQSSNAPTATKTSTTIRTLITPPRSSAKLATPMKPLQSPAASTPKPALLSPALPAGKRIPAPAATATPTKLSQRRIQIPPSTR